MVLVGSQAADKFTLKLTSPFVSPLVLNGVGYSRLQSVGKEVRASLEQSGIGKRGLSKRPNAEVMYGALEEIRENGWIALSALISDEMPQHRAQPAQLRQFLQAVLTHAPRGQIPVLRFESPIDLPIDLMPALQPPREAFRRNTADILYEQARTWFVGLQFAVQKIRKGNETAGPDLIPAVDAGRVVLAPYWHRGLPGVADLVSDLSSLGFLAVYPPLPDDSTIRLRDERDVARLLVDGRRPPEAIVHIACHGEARDDQPSPRHALRLAGGRGFGRRELNVTVKSLMSGGAAVALHGPLAVITACGAADVRYDSPVSIPDALLYAGFRSVVSPLVSVEVGPGYAMTLFFYEALGRRNVSVGAALVEARRHLLEGHGHALGLLHACYGDTRLRLADATVD